MFFFDPELRDILTAVIGLACRGGERLDIPRIHSVLNELKGREAFLSGLYFSITGAVCYSRQVEETLRSLIARGILVSKENDVLMIPGEAVREIRSHLLRILPSSLYDSLLGASRRFHWRMFSRIPR